MNQSRESRFVSDYLLDHVDGNELQFSDAFNDTLVEEEVSKRTDPFDELKLFKKDVTVQVCCRSLFLFFTRAISDSIESIDIEVSEFLGIKVNLAFVSFSFGLNRVFC